MDSARAEAWHSLVENAAEFADTEGAAKVLEEKLTDLYADPEKRLVRVNLADLGDIDYVGDLDMSVSESRVLTITDRERGIIFIAQPEVWRWARLFHGDEDEAA